METLPVLDKLATENSSKQTSTENSSKQTRIPYTLYYRQGSNPHSQFLVFNHSAVADIHSIVERAKRHCEIMNYRFVSVRPLVIDLDAAERRQQGSEEL